MTLAKKISSENVIESRTTLTSLDPEGIIRAISKPNCGNHTLEGAKHNVESTKALWNGKKRPIFCDYREVTSQSRECQAYYASSEVSEYYCACAILIKSPLSKLVANFFLGLRKPITPTKLFTDENEAVMWLKGFQK